MQRPLILITNDDGIRSLGLRAAASACAALGDLFIVAPAVQQTGQGRAKPVGSSGQITVHTLDLGGGRPPVTAYAVDASPAQVVEIALVELLPFHCRTGIEPQRTVNLAISGINYGENIGEGVTVSGTIGAAMEAASFGIPALAVSQQTQAEHYWSHDAALDFMATAGMVRQFAAWVLERGLPPGVDVLKIDAPEGVTPETPWRWTRVSRRRYFFPVAPERKSLDERARMGFTTHVDPALVEPDSDIYAVAIDHVISVTPLSNDLTAKVTIPA
ncbi:MAG TPA: 5'/3'-nucleotidase SurE, partial [Caldilineaceae bacterium]|nr:5'/3'-nucleotidase SurE [Caldilineaceae bacterium]